MREAIAKKFTGRSGSKKKRSHVRPTERQLRETIRKLCKAADISFTSYAYWSTSEQLRKEVRAARSMLRGRWSNPREPLTSLERRAVEDAR